MSYQVLARKWRPQGFDEVAGQAHVTTPLRNAIRLGRVPHAILLTGPRGVGKTTLARILARCLNCEKGPTDTPCGRCSPCLEIASGSSTDVQEIDAASRTSVDDVRELIEAVRYAAAPGKHRIFVVDEVHMLSTPAFNALLKTLEEPPPRSLFVFATTNPEKIPFTVVSRCQRYDLRRLAAAEIAARLGEIARAENVRISERSLLAVAREADGSLRDALTLLDQIIAYGGAEVDDERVAEVLDLIDRRLLLAIAEACIDGAPAPALEACARAAEAGVDARRLAGELLRTLRDLVVLRVAPNTPGLVEAADAELAALRELAERTEEARLRRMFRALLREQEDLAWAPVPFDVLEMAIVRLATLASGDDVATLLARLDALERQLAGEPGPGRGSAGSAPTGSPEPGAGRARTPRGGGPSRASAPPEDAGAAAAEEAPALASEPPPEPLAPGEESAPPEIVFDRLRAFAQQHNRSLFSALDGGRLIERARDRLRLALPEGFAARRLEARQRDLEEVCARFFGAPVRVSLSLETAGGAAPRTAAASDPEASRRRRQEALGHPGLHAALEILGGEIVEIRPLGGER